MYKVAVVQFEPILFDTEYNLNTILSYIGQADTDLIVFPELATSGYVFDTVDEVATVAESVPDGRCFIAIIEAAQKYNCSVVYGFVEQVGSTFYNSSVLINPDGTYHVYRKVHLFDREKLFFEPGNKGFFVSEAKHGVRVGMMICFDWQFPEAARSLALQNAQIICHPSNLVLPWCQQAMTTRALENRVFCITANRLGTETNGSTTLHFTGQSQILNTTGEVLCRLSVDKPELSIVEIDPTVADVKDINLRNNLFADRRPNSYIKK
ncbi:MAG: beta-ureidopropionase [Candidatus Cloacimonetes bacterium HGW-Cloacimonetes-1]|nr:MAG: beta-ureidopropionase [Candidatus Cloacimonetes bacterium HGW-Cloacimonetes-1]